jgi:protein-S-isoprenylcysteine O-methyltransferase Ste14
VDTIFAADVGILIVLLAGAIWSVAFPERRLWPPPAKGSWQYRLTWIFFYSVFGLNAGLLIFDWNAWILQSNLRFVIGLPLAVLGTLLLIWGVNTLGTRNTSGIKNGFITTGPYAFTRNPQYLGDMVLFIGLSFIANSAHLWITHLLTILVFTVTPLAEEAWLEGVYGEDYAQYKRRTSRFL